MSYDPGQPTTPRQVDATTWAIDSFRDGKESSYLVKIHLEGCTCTCPHYTTRLVGTDAQCKHIVAVLTRIEATKPTTFGAAAARAQRLSDENLSFWLAKHQEAGNAAVQSAILCELAARKLATDKDAELRRIFA